MTEDQKKKISEALKKSHALKKAQKETEVKEVAEVKEEPKKEIRFKLNYAFIYNKGDIVPDELLRTKADELKLRNII